MRLPDSDGRRIVPNLVMFLVVSVLCGVLAAGLLMPAVRGLSKTSSAASGTLEKLPTELTQETLPQRTVIVTKNGQLMAALFSQNRVTEPLSNVAHIMQQAQVAIEDDRFYQHGALDLRGTLRALVTNQASGGVSQGGSSITQQLVKLTLLQQAKTPAEQAAATADTYERKIKELRYAIALEDNLSKDQILERYLNIAYYGDGSYGVEAAARHYFSTNASKLTLPQAALLAGIVKNPYSYDPTNGAAGAKAATTRRNTVIARMAQLHVISAATAKAAEKSPLGLHVTPIPNGCANTTVKDAQFYCQYVVSQLLQDKTIGATPALAERRLKEGGLTIQTSFDVNTQLAAQKALDNRAQATDTSAAAMTVVQPGSGEVLAMVQSKPYGNDPTKQSSYNWNVPRWSSAPATKTSTCEAAPNCFLNGLGGFQNGSTMKAFTIAAALEAGKTPDYRINSPQEIDLSGKKFNTCTGTTEDPDYHPKNSTAGGDLTMTQAAENSTNTYFLQLSQQIGLCAPATLAGKMGMYNAFNGAALSQVPSFTLGVDNVTPLQVSNAYATFAARGKYCTPQFITGISGPKNSSGPKGTLAPPPHTCKQVMPTYIADTVNQILQQVVSKGTGAPAKLDDRPAAGKTGTTNSNVAVWFAGYTPQLAGAAVVSSTKDLTNLKKLTLNGNSIQDPTGGHTAGGIWHDVMTALDDQLQLPKQDFTEPGQQDLSGNGVEIPDLTGYSVTHATQQLEALGFSVAVDDQERYSSEPHGSVAYTDPRAGTQVVKGALITLYESAGYQPRKKSKRSTSSHKSQQPTNPYFPPRNQTGIGGG